MKNSLQARLNCSEPLAFKVKDKDVSITKKYCIPISIQNISSIHKFIFKIADFRATLKVIAILDHTHSKMIGSPFSLAEFLPASKKSVYSICSFLKYREF